MVGGVKDNIMSLFKTNTAKNYSKPRKLKKKKTIRKQNN